MTEYLGWAATGVFVASYFCARPFLLRSVQMAGAAMWVCYGILIGASPVVVANLLVLAAAAWTARDRGQTTGVRPPGSDHRGQTTGVRPPGSDHRGQTTGVRPPGSDH